MKLHVTDNLIKEAKPREKVWCLVEADRTYRGLQLAIFPNGAKRWRFRFTLDGKAGLEGLGVYPDMSLAQAREACVRSRQLVQQGIKPTEYKKQKAVEHTQNFNRKQINLADAQLLGFYHCERGYSIESLIESMGLTKKEWGFMKSGGSETVKILPDELIEAIDKVFA